MRQRVVSLASELKNAMKNVVAHADYSRESRCLQLGVYSHSAPFARAVPRALRFADTAHVLDPWIATESIPTPLASAYLCCSY